MTSTLQPAAADARPPRRVLAFWPVFAGTLVSDVVSKRLVEQDLNLQVPRDVVGDWVRLTLTYNTGAAMNLSLGSASRVAFALIAAVMLVVIFRMYRRTPSHDVSQAAALALIAAGALGNMIDRIRSPRGVVDFIDVGMGDWRFYTFNVADMGVSVGAVLLAVLLTRRTAMTE